MEYGEALIRALERQRNDALNMCAQLMAQVDMLQDKVRTLEGLPDPKNVAGMAPVDENPAS